MRAHPHSRGENWQWIAGIATEVGSSPLTRGKQLTLVRALPQERLIPTHAGKTPHACTERSDAGAHPHSRGENPPERPQLVPRAGSSPLTRGKLVRALPQDIHRRLIPTHAGKTSASPWLRIASWAHPHSRGENERRHRSVTSRSGSSPLTRGKHAKAVEAKRIEGLIPTHAGKTRGAGAPHAGTRAHPHSRGENTS